MLRIANCSGFFGDRLSAAREMVEGGPIDVLTGDYLAELTMLVLYKNRRRDPDTGYATTFVRQCEEVLGTCLERGIRIVVNAGGLNPAGLAGRVAEVARGLGLQPRIAHVTGDDVRGRLDPAAFPTPPVTANAYLGAWGIVEALRAGADVVICPRVSDASLVVGPCAWRFGWALDDWDALAGAVAAGHVLECGAQATGGNYAFAFEEVADPLHLGFPIAEMHPDGTAVITKHPGTGGAVTPGTVTAQLVYEIDGARYVNPDVVARFDALAVEQVGPDRVRLSGAAGEPAPETLKVSVNRLGGFLQTVRFALTGLDVERKAAMARAGLFAELGGEEQFAGVETRLVRSDRPDAASNDAAVAWLEVTLKDTDERRLGRRVFDAAIALALASYPGFFADVPRSASAYGVYSPAFLPAADVEHRVVLPDGSTITPPEPPRAPPAGELAEPEPPPPVPAGTTVRGPLGRAFGARSGDKGGNANIGLWARGDAGYAWLVRALDVEALRALLPEADGLDVTRTVLPGLRAVNFVVHGLLGEGVASSTRPDPQAKGLGEFVRSREVDLPVEIL